MNKDKKEKDNYNNNHIKNNLKEHNSNLIYNITKDKTKTSNYLYNNYNNLSLKEVKDTDSFKIKDNVISNISVYKFIVKLYEMLRNSKLNNVLSWNKEGTIIEIKDERKFIDEVLPYYFKHNNMSNFIRQLNMYNFKKIKNYKNNYIAYYNNLFVRDNPELIKEITRKQLKNNFTNIFLNSNSNSYNIASNNKSKISNTKNITNITNNTYNTNININNLNNTNESKCKIKEENLINDNKVELNNYKIKNNCNYRKETTTPLKDSLKIEIKKKINTLNDDNIIKKINTLFKKLFFLEEKLKKVENSNNTLINNNKTFSNDINSKAYYINKLELLVFYIVSVIIPRIKSNNNCMNTDNNLVINNNNNNKLNIDSLDSLNIDNNKVVKKKSDSIQKKDINLKYNEDIESLYNYVESDINNYNNIVNKHDKNEEFCPSDNNVLKTTKNKIYSTQDNIEISCNNTTNIDYLRKKRLNLNNNIKNIKNNDSNCILNDLDEDSTLLNMFFKEILFKFNNYLKSKNNISSNYNSLAKQLTPNFSLMPYKNCLQSSLNNYDYVKDTASDKSIISNSLDNQQYYKSTFGQNDQANINFEDDIDDFNYRYSESKIDYEVLKLLNNESRINIDNIDENIDNIHKDYKKQIYFKVNNNISTTSIKNIDNKYANTNIIENNNQSNKDLIKLSNITDNDILLNNNIDNTCYKLKNELNHLKDNINKKLNNNEYTSIDNNIISNIKNICENKTIDTKICNISCKELYNNNSILLSIPVDSENNNLTLNQSKSDNKTLNNKSEKKKSNSFTSYLKKNNSFKIYNSLNTNNNINQSFLFKNLTSSSSNNNNSTLNNFIPSHISIVNNSINNNVRYCDKSRTSSGNYNLQLGGSIPNTNNPYSSFKITKNNILVNANNTPSNEENIGTSKKYISNTQNLVHFSDERGTFLNKKISNYSSHNNIIKNKSKNINDSYFAGSSGNSRKLSEDDVLDSNLKKYKSIESYINKI